MIRRVAGLLRSRRLVIALLVAVAVASLVATVVPQGDAGDAAVARWDAERPLLGRVADALRLHGMFSSPAFLVLVALLAASTAACAAERTSEATAAVRLAPGVGEAEIARLRRRADLEWRVQGGVDHADALSAVARVASSRKMRIRAGSRALEAVSGRWSVWGSPVFHWSLVALIIVLAVGRATRSEGEVDLRVGETVREAPDAYRALRTGPLFLGGHTGYELSVTHLAPSLVVGGVERGPAPYVVLSRAGNVLASQYVYANEPLRRESLMLSRGPLGLAVAMSVEDSAGISVGGVEFSVPYSNGPEGATEPIEIALRDESQAARIMDLRVEVGSAPSRGTSAKPAPDLIPAVVETATPDSDRWGEPVEMLLGEAIPLSPDGGTWLRFASLDDSVTLAVVNDWSVPWIWALLGLALFAVTVALLVPFRRVVAMVDGSEGAAVLRVAVGVGREPEFRRLFVEEVRAALSGTGADGRGDADDGNA